MVIKKINFEYIILFGIHESSLTLIGN
jgi:hypothetical protein